MQSQPLLLHRSAKFDPPLLNSVLGVRPVRAAKGEDLGCPPPLLALSDLDRMGHFVP